MKDLKILEHSQLMDKFRDIKAHLKKHKRFIGRRELKLAEDHLHKTPKYSLAPVIKDRYPTFVDALRDLDDALCLVALFAQLPQHLTLDIRKEDLDNCAKLYSDFMLYCTTAQTFTKAFFSIKGVYYRVEIMGTPVTWISPYKFNTRIPFDIDYKVMGTFLEFYQGLLKFINYKLFTDIGLDYPVPEQMLPTSETGPHFDCEKVREIQAHVQKLYAAAEHEAEVDPAFKETEEMQAMNKRGNQAKKQRKLFSNCKFWLGRETPIYLLQHLILSFGGQYVLQDDSPSMEGVTHVCMDRPVPANQRDKSKEYVVPQYIADSLNNLFLLPTKPYMPGQPAPAHLSPFIDNESAGYIPDRQREMNTLAGVATAVVESESSDEEEAPAKQQKAESSDDGKGDAESSDEEESEEEPVSKKPELNAAQKAKKEAKLKADLQKEQQEMGKMLMT